MTAAPCSAAFAAFLVCTGKIHLTSTTAVASATPSCTHAAPSSPVVLLQTQGRSSVPSMPCLRSLALTAASTASAHPARCARRHVKSSSGQLPGARVSRVCKTPKTPCLSARMVPGNICSSTWGGMRTRGWYQASSTGGACVTLETRKELF